MNEKTENMVHIGDGVYAYFDGYQIELKVGSHEAPTVVYLEPQVLNNLNRFYSKMTEEGK
jgi:serine phosphatase RsbU (regulator of sigma subunit)